MHKIETNVKTEQSIVYQNINLYFQEGLKILNFIFIFSLLEILYN